VLAEGDGIRDRACAGAAAGSNHGSDRSSVTVVTSGGLDAQHEHGMASLRADSVPRRWTRAVWFRLAVAFMPFIVLALLAVLFGR
jgi:prepilin signal peptidase PulO-like enzyme (type II secretory pathway)